MARPSPLTPGAIALRDAVAPGAGQLIGLRELARELGIAPQSVAAWRDAKARPVAHFREALFKLLGIPVDAWMSGEERRIADLPRERKLDRERKPSKALTSSVRKSKARRAAA